MVEEIMVQKTGVEKSGVEISFNTYILLQVVEMEKLLLLSHTYDMNLKFTSKAQLLSDIF